MPSGKTLSEGLLLVCCVALIKIQQLPLQDKQSLLVGWCLHPLKSFTLGKTLPGVRDGAKHLTARESFEKVCDFGWNSLYWESRSIQNKLQAQQNVCGGREQATSFGQPYERGQRRKMGHSDKRRAHSCDIWRVQGRVASHELELVAMLHSDLFANRYLFLLIKTRMHPVLKCKLLTIYLHSCTWVGKNPSPTWNGIAICSDNSCTVFVDQPNSSRDAW